MKTEIRTRNGWYYAIVPRQRGLGRALVKWLGTRSKTEAEKLANLADLEQMGLAAKANAIGRDVWTRLLAGRRVRVRDAVEEYESHQTLLGHREGTIKANAYAIDMFLRFTQLANQPIAMIEAEQVAAFVNQPGDWKLARREKWLSILKTFFDFCFEKHYIVTNPAHDVAVRLEGLTQEQMISERNEPFTEGEIKLLLSSIPKTDYWYGAVLFASTYGLRLSTVAQIEETNIVGNQLRIYATKGRRVVNERLSDELIEWLDLWRTVRPASDLPHLFPVQASLTNMRLSEKFVRICRRLGIEGKSFHGLRGTATARVWNNALEDLGSREARALASMVATHGFRRVQALLGHAPGSDVTEKHYMPRAV